MRDMDFVNKIFMQLLKVEHIIPVCIIPFDIENKKLLPHYKPSITEV